MPRKSLERPARFGSIAVTPTHTRGVWLKPHQDRAADSSQCPGALYYWGASGYDSNSRLVRSDGKAEVCRALAKAHGPVAIVGDGATDLAARAGGAYVIGFGGVSRRQAMFEGADCFVADTTLVRTLEVLLTEAEFKRWRGHLQSGKRE
jgi:hypothetical protein